MQTGKLHNGWGGIAYGDKKTEMNHNTLQGNMKPWVLFVDMNSFFATCEQEVNYYLRGRPVGVCVYTGKYGCVIAPSIEAKKAGVKLGMRLNEAMKICPDLVPLETHPKRYREFHVRIIQVLKKYSNDVIPRSIDEAVVNLHGYQNIYNHPFEVAKKIKHDIKTEVGEWIKCSIGIAPNAFLAKLASDLQKPDGLVMITPENIDQVLSGLQLKDLPGISDGMEARLNKGGIYTPVQLRHTDPQILKIICRSVIGLQWHYRLNFAEMDMATHDYKSMSAMRHLSSEQRENTETVHAILLSLCMRLEQRMVRREVFCKKVYFTIKYINNQRYDDEFKCNVPLQDGIDILHILKERMQKNEQKMGCLSIINQQVSALCVVITDFVHQELVQYSLFENHSKKDALRKAVYALKDRFGQEKLMRASEISEQTVLKDVIGFGSIKDLDERDLFDTI